MHSQAERSIRRWSAAAAAAAAVTGIGITGSLALARADDGSAAADTTTAHPRTVHSGPLAEQPLTSDPEWDDDAARADEPAMSAPAAGVQPDQQPGTANRDGFSSVTPPVAGAGGGAHSSSRAS